MLRSGQATAITRRHLVITSPYRRLDSRPVAVKIVAPTRRRGLIEYTAKKCQGRLASSIPGDWNLGTLIFSFLDKSPARDFITKVDEALKDAEGNGQ